ncbi:cellulose biosynthesis cyclic di-GMP-binding regulatory protein BcsB [Vibrio sp. ZSDZ34]|uniref:Cyclic di-GMP-binding protein n=1 Tax=Vibrio gelatinilyticus TaxID=2893468 RepID=A0A9X2AV28_9VIBR|nr:cellulose biosynthesis cyclic di-GMP-binding regulatory protein BcsB [Vibrio gelatinilyticus]MCJ2376524.1 cellulose biosynthesis cyclic di-GMP-binding regulatory protein BcsB [Vibrio gelatinilyticus]
MAISVQAEESIIEYNFSQLSGDRSIAIKGNGSSAYIGFGSRLDKVITDGTLHLEYLPSPSLVNNVSHIRVFLNEELMDVVSLKRDTISEVKTKDIKLDGRFFKNYNQLRFELAGKIDAECSDASDPALWWELRSSSKIILNVKSLEIANELSLLPSPFFDSRDFRNVSIPIVIPHGLSLKGMHAAGTVASFFSSGAEWRTVEFQVSRDALPNSSSLVLATNEHRPQFLKDLPYIDQPTVQMVSHPLDSTKKLLLIMGEDEEQLKQAAIGLAEGSQLMSGEIAYIKQVKRLTEREPYDAPNWLPTNRAVRFSELIEGQYQLQSEGVSLVPIEVNFTLPPSLFTWNANSIPMKLNFRHSPPEEETNSSRLNVSINDQFIRAFPLDSETAASTQDIWRLPFWGADSSGRSGMVDIPGFKTSVDNKLSFEFQVAESSTGVCRGTQPIKKYAVIDGNSQIDFTGYPHYIRMPNNQVFATSGFPFSKMADLSETAIIVNPNTSIKEIELYLSTVGFISRKTGLPAYQFTLHDTWDETELTNKDILVLGNKVGNKYREQDTSLGAVYSSQDGRTLEAGDPFTKTDTSGFAKLKGNRPSIETSIAARGPFAFIASFESPVSSHRTVTVLSTRDDYSVPLLLNALNERTQSIFGSLAIVSGTEVTSYQFGDYYYLGELPVYELVWYHFAERPMLMVAIAILIVVVLTMIAWRTLSRYAKKRVSQGN